MRGQLGLEMTNTHDANWYPDPMQRHQYRYWDGRNWTDHVSDHGQQSLDALVAPAVSRAHSIIPGHLGSRLSDVGKQVFASQTPYVDVSDYYLAGFLAAGAPTEDPEWSRFVDQFVEELVSMATTGGGGWATAGAFHVAKDFVKGEDWSKPNLVQLLDSALRFLVSVRADPSRIPNFAMPRWMQIRGEGL